jgi:hypothetical protein
MRRIVVTTIGLILALADVAFASIKGTAFVLGSLHGESRVCRRAYTW